MTQLGREHLEKMGGLAATYPEACGRVVSRPCAWTRIAEHHEQRKRMTRHIEVVGAVIVSEGHVLCTQRGGNGPLSGLWEFPGGKVEPGEAPGEALAREIYEELRCQISVGERVTATRHEYMFATVHLTTFYCTLVEGHPSLTEHTEMRWLPPSDLSTLDWAPADVPAVALIEVHLTAVER